jgi:signal transduction histidine kinase
VRKDGSEVTVEAGVARLPREGTPRWLVIFRDISERKAAERALVRASKFESLGQLSGGVAHDFNNILAAIMGNAALVRLAGAATEESADALATIEKAAQRGADITARLLAFAQGGFGTFETVDLRRVAREAVALANAGAPSTLSLTLNTGAEPVEVEGDPAHLLQALVNVVLNAREAAGPEGIITVGVQRRGTLADITVSDNGRGIEPEIIDRVFEPFFTTRGPAGTGLGLAIAFRVVHAHHGRIRVTSAPGKGATFLLTFPVAGTRVVPPAAEPTAEG